MLTVQRFDHLVLTCRDVAATIRFYTEVLGMKEVTFGAGRKALSFGRQKFNLHPMGQVPEVGELGGIRQVVDELLHPAVGRRLACDELDDMPAVDRLDRRQDLARGEAGLEDGRAEGRIEGGL